MDEQKLGTWCAVVVTPCCRKFHLCTCMVFQPASLTVLHGLTALRLVSLVQLKQEGSTACMPALLALMAANAGCEVVTFRANVASCPEAPVCGHMEVVMYV